MTTRATVTIDSIVVYCHADGYPECCGKIIKSLLPHPDEYWDCEEIATRIVRHGDYGDFMCADGAHGDEEFEYVIDCKSKTFTAFKLSWVYGNNLSRKIKTPIETEEVK